MYYFLDSLTHSNTIDIEGYKSELYLMNLNYFYLIWKNYYISDINKHKPSLCAITGDFNARSSYW